MATTGDNLGGKIPAPTSGEIGTGAPALINNLIVAATAIAGLVVLMNFIVAGYTFLSAGGDPKKISEAWSKMWQSLLGLLIVVGAVALVGIIGKVFGITDILRPQFVGP